MFELIEFLHAIKKMSPELKAYLRKVLLPYHFKEGQIILNIGEIHKDILYIQKGLVRAYRYNFKGEEVSNWFMKEKDVFISVKSFFSRVPSLEILVAYEDCTCFGFDHDMLDKICKEMPEFKDHRIIITEAYYCLSMERETEFKNEPIDIKFEKLMEKSPDLIERVKDEDLASYLGVRPRTLSRMKSNYYKKHSLQKPRKKSRKKLKSA